MERSLLVRDYMSKPPRSVGLDQALSHALARMHVLGVRHLPVLEGGALVGVLSERDGALAKAAAPEAAQSLRVEDAMSAVPYCVSPDAPLREVARHLAARKLGCAVVTEDLKVVGMLTTTDAMRALGEVLEAHADLPSGARVRDRAPSSRPRGKASPSAAPAAS
jgi:acetoin utilization protein AcuB